MRPSLRTRYRSTITANHEPALRLEGQVVRIVVVLLCLATTSFLTLRSLSAEQTTRLRIAFSSAEPLSWSCDMQVDGATASQLVPLGLDLNCVGAGTLEANRLTVRHPRPVRQDVYDLTFSGDQGATLEFRLAGSDHKATIPIDAARREPQRAMLGEQGPSILVERLAADRLPVRFEQPTRLYAPGKPFRFSVQPDLDQIEPGSPFEWTASLHRTSGSGVSSDPVWKSGEQRAEAPVEGLPTYEIEIPLPEEEGVYEVRLQIMRPPGFTSRFMPNGGTRLLAERHFEILVFDSMQRPRAPGAWEEVASFDPATDQRGQWMQKWIDWRRFSSRTSSPALVSSAGEPQRTADGLTSLIPPTPESGAAHWQAFPLPISEPGQPHQIEIEVGGHDQETQIAIALFDEGVLDRLEPMGDALLWESPRWGNRLSNERVKLLCWPRSSAPLLIVANPSAEHAAHFGRVRIYRSTGQATEIPEQERTISLDWNDPDLAKQVGADLARARGGQFAYANLRTFYQTAKRLADRVESAGANNGLVTLHRNGAGLLPSNVLEGRPLHQMAHWDQGTVDLPAIDPLELLLAEFTRRGLTLTPAIDLAGPVAEIERAYRAGNNDSLLWQSQGERFTYNPLDPDVSRALRQVAERFASRYAGRAGLEGIAFRMGTRSGWLLPPGRGGYDAATVDRFLASQGLRWPEGAPRTQAIHAEALAAQLLQPWQAWRAEQLAVHLQRMTQPHGMPLRCLPDRLETHPALSSGLTPQLSKGIDTQAILGDLGLNTSSISQLAPYTAQPMTIGVRLPTGDCDQSPLTDSLSEAIASLSSESTEEAPRIESGVRHIVSHRANCRLIRSAELLNVVRSGATRSGAARSDKDLTLRCIVQPAGESSAKLAEGLFALHAKHVIDAGPATAGWINQRDTNLRRLATRLPSLPQKEANAFANSTSSNDDNAQPKPLHSDLLLNAIDLGAEGTLLVARNPTDWPRQANATIEVPSRALGTPLAGAAGTPEWFAAGRHAMTLRLAPHEAALWRFTQPGVRPIGLRLSPVPEAEQQLASAIDRLKRTDRTAHRSYAFVPNPSFEEADSQGRTLRWTLGPEAEGPSTAPSKPPAGARALKLAATQATAEATSAPFAIPSTGQFAIRFQALAEQLNDVTELAVEFRTPDGGYSVRTRVSAEQLGPARAMANNTTASNTTTSHDTAQWRELIFAVDDLPLLPGGQMQIRFTLEGGGTLWIDAIEAEDLILPLDAYAEDTKAQRLALVRLTLSAESALEQGRLADCRDILDSYWSQFLTSNFPQSPIAEAKPEEPAEDEALADGPPDEAAEEEPSVAERLRGYLPRLWR